jgi:hypothetical protein
MAELCDRLGYGLMDPRWISLMFVSLDSVQQLVRLRNSVALRPSQPFVWEYPKTKAYM